MAIYMVKCPSCGSATELNDEREFTYCTECGKKILTQDAELWTEADAPASDAPAVPDIPDVPGVPGVPGVPDAEAPAADIVPSDDTTTSVGHDADIVPQPDDAPEPAAETPAAVYDGPPLTNAEHLDYLILHQPQPLDGMICRASDECAAYANDLHALVLELRGRYAAMNHAEEATCLDFLERGIGYCEYLDTRRLKFLAGTHEEKGRTVEDYGTYPVSKTLLKEIKDTREHFVAQYNGFFQPKIASAKAALEDTKEKIKNLPGAMRFYHSFCTPLMGILTLALFAIGLVPILLKLENLDLRINIPIAVVGGALFIAWVVTTVMWVIKGGSARQLYKAADRQVGEVRTYRAKLKS